MLNSSSSSPALPIIPPELPFFCLDASGVVRFWNDACARLTGMESHKVLCTRSHWQAFYRSPRQCLADMLLSGKIEELQQKYPATLHRPSPDAVSCLLHTEKPLNGSGSIWTQAGLLRDADGNVTGAYQVLQIVSLPQLSAFSPVIEAFIDKFPLPVALVVKQKIVATNMAYAKLTGYDSPDDMLGMPTGIFLDDSDKERFFSLNADNHKNIISGRTYQWKYRVRGKVRYVEGHPSVFLWGNETCLISTIVDITDTVAKEQAMEKERLRLEKENARLLAKVSSKDSVFFGEGPAMRRTMNLALQMGKSDANLVILGETGTGKSLLARVIHEVSPRREHPFIMVNCAAIPEALFESEFFGYVKGAFTGAQNNKQGFLGAAHKGTLFLDEVAELSPAMQAKLLHAIETKTFTPVGSNIPQSGDVRLICATNRDLVRMVKDGTLREDFFYRIFVMDIPIPPLRERREDLPGLIEFFLNKFSPMDASPRIPEELMNRMLAYDWPGNVRELQNVILRYLATGQAHLLSPSRDDTPDGHKQKQRSVPHETLEQTLARTERECILNALREHNGNKVRAAEELGVNLRTFHRRCAKLGIMRQLSLPDDTPSEP